ncbi:hypothetical protein HW130_16605 [Streptomyces sp. PKU-EA00015]|uniref:hypothetical protein n=1 Tax=Streptomyces sp. PKU-EA00015 TaxID=2748326 RepID=UPI0015A1F110|nr:hypothetical protein [Streptomyces sp. PKU-EA00015]NWF27866.1 hypothetical protein [Streptomyces sp. PKU-EA00015]
MLHVRAFFGPFAQAQYPDYESTRDAGRSGNNFSWATAKCPGTSARALFTVSATQYTDEEVEDFARSALTEFAERSAKQHGCTDLKLPR